MTEMEMMMNIIAGPIRKLGIAAVMFLAACSGRDGKPPERPPDSVATSTSRAGAVHAAPSAHTPTPSTRHSDSAASPAAIDPIVAGKSVGKVKVGEDFAMVVKTLGDPDSSDAGMGHVAASWGSKRATGSAAPHRLDIYASFNADGSEHVVREIRVTSPRFTAAPGISTGSRFADISRTYKSIRVVATYDDGAGPVMIYDDVKNGIAFEVMGAKGNPAGHCVAIIVHEPGRPVGMEYLPMHNYLKSEGTTGK
ncbi:MAG: hypothetical protein JWQ98_844 [Chlorobi bacterium]|nr:hypothetical protein [Chlorobiota bacterium]